MTDPNHPPISGDTRRDARRIWQRQPLRPLGTVARFLLCLAVAGLLAWLAQTQAGLAAAPARMLFILVLAAELWLFEVVPAYSVGVLVIALQILLLGNPQNGVFAESADDWQTFVVVLGHPLIWLFFGGFVLAAAIARTGLDRSLARRLLMLFGSSPSRLLFGIMAGSLLFSMIMSNTATTAMMLALTAPVVASLSEDSPYTRALLLGVPFAANVGGMATLIGSPPNAIAAGALASVPGQSIGFLTWMIYGLPPALLLFLVVFSYLRIRYPIAAGDVLCLPTQHQPVGNGAPRWQRQLAVGTLAVTLLLWMTGEWTAIPTAVVSFLPITVFTATGILRDRDVRQLPWDILLLLAGGLALGNGVRDTGLADWLVAALPLDGLGSWGVIFLLCYVTVLLSNLMSNTAAANILVPIAVVMATGFETLAVVPLALCASCAMSLPISTPPNAMAFASGRLAVTDFMSGGMLVGLLAPPIVVGWLALLRLG
ncbi:MAG TPA: DASS family sodium-coupled anion symporter [Pseudomonadales bacterium]